MIIVARQLRHYRAMLSIPELVLPSNHQPSARQVRNSLAMERALAQPAQTAALLLAATKSQLLDPARFVAGCRRYGTERVIAVSHKWVLRSFRQQLGNLPAYGEFVNTSERANQPVEFDSSNGIVLSLPCSPCLISLTFASRPESDKAVLYCGLRIICYYLSPFYFVGIDPPLYEESGFAHQLHELRAAGWLNGESFTPAFGDWALLEHADFGYQYESCDTESIREHVEELLALERGLTGDWRHVVNRGLGTAGKRKAPLRACTKFLTQLTKDCQDKALKAWALKLVDAIEVSKQCSGTLELVREFQMEWEEGYCDYAYGTAVMLEQYGYEEAEQCLNGVCESEMAALRLRVSSRDDFVKLRPALRLFQTGLAALHELIALEN